MKLQFNRSSLIFIHTEKHTTLLLMMNVQLVYVLLENLMKTKV